jgi:hypothetical protein
MDRSDDALICNGSETSWQLTSAKAQIRFSGGSVNDDEFLYLMIWRPGRCFSMILQIPGQGSAS